MQAFTAQPLKCQTSENPFNDSYLLAALIIPHLETYLALHSEVKYLLLEYPPEHLSTILAVQKLVGVDLMKVAQIVDTKSKNLPFTHLRGTSISKVDSGSLKRKSLRSSDVSASKANFLVTSTASDSEIAEFISTVWKVLAEESDYYKAESEPRRAFVKASEKAPEAVQEKTIAEKPEKPEKKRPPPLHSTFSPFPKVTEGPKSPMSPAPNTAIFPPRTPTIPIPPPPSRPASIAETTRTFKSMRSRHSRTSKRRPVGDAMSVYTFDPAEDSDYDAEERRLMPIFLQKRQVRKGNSRKALKFLGLA